VIRSLRVADLEIALDVEPGPLESLIIENWGGFLTRVSAPRCRLRLEGLATRRPADRGSVILERVGPHQVRLDHPGLTGKLDTAGTGTVEVEARVENIEYLMQVVLSLATETDSAVLMRSTGAISHGRGHLFVGEAGGPVALPGDLAGRPSLGSDLVVLRKVEDRWWLFSTPFRSRNGPVPPRRAPLDGVWTLRQGETFEVTPMERLGALRAVMDSAVHAVADETSTMAVFHVAAGVAEAVPSSSITVQGDVGFWEEVDAVGRALQLRRALLRWEKPSFSDAG
jgi:hypothetical protein